MRESVKELVQIVVNTLPIGEPIYEFGSLQVAEQEGWADLRPYFPGKEYVGCDMREGPGVDKVMDLHSVDLPSESVGTILSVDTFEHVEYPHKAMTEIHRVLRPGGIAVITSVLNFPIHEYPHDYWRFTPDAFRSLLKQFSAQFVDFAGEVEFPHTVVGIGFKDCVGPTREFLRYFEDWKEAWVRVDRRKKRRIGVWTAVRGLLRQH